ncbi:hypothetical protein DPMN_018844 [Dreissena polymorpha]|uniref:Secreted protein n=1 Tax=Dreissena polymorpha TaxID=45954 RepID=A0A9D4NK24_DREPO|nr:hypothetical protein DPMN_018844 [Dreissena polymorpha]
MPVGARFKWWWWHVQMCVALGRRASEQGRHAARRTHVHAGRRRVHVGTDGRRRACSGRERRPERLVSIVTGDVSVVTGT